MGKTGYSGPIDSAGGFKVGGTTVIDKDLKIIGDIHATPGSISSEELAESVLKVVTVNIGPEDIVGTAAGDIGHAAGAVLVAAPGATKTLEFVSATLLYTFGVAAYTGGNNDLVIRQGTTAVSAAIADADLIGDTASDIAYVGALSAADIKLTKNSTLNLAGTAYTNPGTATGTLSVRIAYRVHTA